MTEVSSYRICPQTLGKKIEFNETQMQKIGALLQTIDANKCLCGNDPIMWGYSVGELYKKLTGEGYNRGLAELRNYYSALEYISGESTLSQDLIKKVHAIACPTTPAPGIYKNKNNHMKPRKFVDGKLIEVACVKTTPPRLVHYELGRLINWTNEHLKSGTYHPLFVIALFAYEFCLIHPFRDGNGRTSRILTTFLLINSGYEFAKYSSYEEIVERRKPIYLEKQLHCQVLNIPIFNVVVNLLLFLEEMINEMKHGTVN